LIKLIKFIEKNSVLIFRQTPKEKCIVKSDEGSSINHWTNRIIKWETSKTTGAEKIKTIELFLLLLFDCQSKILIFVVC